MTNDDLILKWMLDELKQEEIKEVTVKMLDRLVDKGTTMAKNKKKLLFGGNNKLVDPLFSKLAILSNIPCDLERIKGPLSPTRILLL